MSNQKSQETAMKRFADGSEACPSFEAKLPCEPNPTETEEEV